MDAFEAISLPESSIPSLKKRFSVDEANRSLVLVRRVVADIMREYSHLRELHARCRKSEDQANPPTAEEFRRQYVALTDRLSYLREELDDIGCELKDYRVGMVDFPARIDGRDVLLCWKMGEERVAHWHELDAGFAGRQPIEMEPA